KRFAKSGVVTFSEAFYQTRASFTARLDSQVRGTSCPHTSSCKMHRGRGPILNPRITSQKFIRGAWLITAVSVAFLCPLPSIAQKPAPAPGVQIVSVQGYPELRADGRPFFVHAAEFSYYRVPPDLWSHSLDRFRELGINTIDLRIPWNWH